MMNCLPHDRFLTPVPPLPEGEGGGMTSLCEIYILGGEQ
jgi:hypothetical protein